MKLRPIDPQDLPEPPEPPELPPSPIPLGLIFGTDANDVLIGGAYAERIYGFNGNDTLRGGGGNDQLYGGAGADTLDGGVGEDMASYLASAAGVTANLATRLGTGGEAQGDSYISVENVEGSAFADTLIGDAGHNKLWGNGGNDVLAGGAGNDELFGGEGNDTLRGGTGADILDGGAGQDAVSYQESSAGVTVYLTGTPANGFESEGFGGDAEGDTYSGIEHVLGSAHDDEIVGTWGANDLTGLAGNDRLDGGYGNDRLLGGEGDDELIGGAGADKLDGGNGNDWISYASTFWNDATSGVNVNLTTGVGFGGDAQGDTYFGIENVDGSAFSDVIVGNAGNNIINSAGGNDVLIGGGGQDRLVAGNGNDVLTGDGDGTVAADTFVISWGGHHPDGSAVITDFQQGVDKIDFISGHHQHQHHMTLQDFGTDGQLAWGFFDQDGLYANSLGAGDEYFFDTASNTLYECSFSNGTLVLGDAIVTINDNVARLQSSDFVLA